MTKRVAGVFTAATDTRQVPAGTVIFDVGSSGEEMFGVVEGKVELRLPNGKTVLVGPDETFGEMALLESATTRSATATTLEDTTLAVINKHRFLFLVHETPTFALNVMSSLADRLRDMQEKA